MAAKMNLDKKKVVLIILAAAAVATALVILLESEENKIRKRFKELASLVEKNPGETKLLMAKKARRIGALVTNPFSISIPEYKVSGTYARQETAQRAAMGRTRFSQLTLEFFDLSVKVIDDVHAEADVTARMSATRLNGDAVEEVHELTCRLQKIEDEWLFHQAEVVDVLEK